MALSKELKDWVNSHIEKVVIDKLKNYNPETEQMPFHYRLLGKDRMAVFSLIQSINTTLGMSIFEELATKIARSDPRFSVVKQKHTIGSVISEKAQNMIQTIINDLSTENIKPNKPEEIEKIKQVANLGELKATKHTKVDLFLVERNGKIYMFDIKTAKPNINEFKGYKRNLLEWVAIYLVANPDTTGESINTCLAIPYNPYEPEPYTRWTIGGMIDLEHELKVGKEFWDFLGGQGTYEDLLACFEQTGILLRQKIDDYIENFKKDQTKR
ncbi:MAG: TdeIII family type II restriction endonuclease [Thermanaerothrix sp.]|uniref:TdeIII family type II restriction endonuclease n=1 Tax=Thermanaerothrix sp. TaxID=2972675 RepID=UPI003C7D533F